ncbi:MAG: hypothetical protein EB127_15800 [Alphaproteobacteria bacterium]|nr:hypothetical protein [Alphaproteobacteria bacterium]
MIITQLDGRYAGGWHFKYAIEFNRPHFDGDLYCEVREWCWQTFGPSRELKFINHQDDNHAWCFMTDNHRTRIYLKSKKELEWFTIRWSECIYQKK